MWQFPPTKGEQHWRAVLNDEKVLWARTMFRQGMRRSEIAKLFHVDWQTMSDAIVGRTWRHLREELG